MNEVDIAIAYLNARKTGRGYVYFAEETRKAYLVKSRAMKELGKMLGEKIEYAYSLWCNSFSAKEFTYCTMRKYFQN